MDVSFDIHNAKGDHLRVALSYYDSETVSMISDDPLTLSLTFYDVTLIRLSGNQNVGYNTLAAVSETLARFMEDNETAVLCFYCDDMTDVDRHHSDITPQEYRSRLFSRMFDQYVKNHGVSHIVNQCVKIVVDGVPRFAHFICRREYRPAVELIGRVLMNK